MEIFQNSDTVQCRVSVDLKTSSESESESESRRKDNKKTRVFSSCKRFRWTHTEARIIDNVERGIVSENNKESDDSNNEDSDDYVESERIMVPSGEYLDDKRQVKALNFNLSISKNKETDKR